MQFTDAVTVAGTRRRDDGYLVADARIARTGIQTYLGSEVGKPAMPLVRVYRPGSEVFSDETLKSAAHRPVTNDHPSELVTSKTWKDVAVGQTGDEIAGEGIFIRVPLMVSDETAINDIEGGKQELSAGYTCDLDFTAGTTPSGEAYDAIQKNIRINHVAIVQRGRAGKQVRIGDGAHAWGITPITSDEETKGNRSMTTRTITVDGLSVELADKDAQIVQRTIDNLNKQITDAHSAQAKADSDHAKLVADKDAQLAKKDAEIDDLKGKVLDAAALDKRVQDRADLITTAKAIAKDVKTDGLTDAAIRKAVVAAKLGDEAVKDKAEAYVDARFDILAEDAAKNPGDPFRTVVQGGLKTDGTNDASTAHAAMEARLRDAWKTPTKGAA
ncbi:DUF2213 domain-containing protein [Phyllobacterium sp. BT25]|uniref:DUF2213 domain-containing protein n=1 Tax=Phyllobacterium pellucidum TaxID=2740464 RepID=A0A849VN08_9HYPH|nr:DUF2213 domain-containing protein [Phyllobacterium pellucidum]NTS31278.1 DUF2213 domain-containing protein [Phyllobacterium pellucidum]